MTAHLRRNTLFAAVAALGVLTAACSGDDTSSKTTTPTVTSGGATSTTAVTSGPTGSGATTPTTVAPTTAAPTTTAAPAVATANGVKATKVKLAVVATATAPLALVTRAGTDTRYIAERAGRVRELKADGTIGATILDISAVVTTDFEKGFLGLAFSPDGTKLYASYTDGGSNTRIDEFAMVGAAVDLATRRAVLQVDQPAGNHNGGNIIFGPDGYLWLGLGDGGGSGDQFNNAQNLDTLLGDMLRFDPSGRGAGAYSIPADNPYVGGGGRPEIWLSGVRNPWRWSFDRATGDLWIGDVGQNAYEEIDRLPAPARGKGANLQWPLREGNHKFRGDAPAGSIGPVFEYDRSDGACSVVGGYVYRGQALPGLAGAYVYGDYCEGTIYALVPNGDSYQRVSLGVSAGKSSLVSFAQDNAGELYTLSLGGTISKIVTA
jgi:glucose/arabinose dehydrogenase